MLLTRKTLNMILKNNKVKIPATLEKELLDDYGKEVTTEDGRILEYSEQDIYEQLRKRLMKCEKQPEPAF
jgi:hypothetical protein